MLLLFCPVESNTSVKLTCEQEPAPFFPLNAVRSVDRWRIEVVFVGVWEKKRHEEQ